MTCPFVPQIELQEEFVVYKMCHWLSLSLVQNDNNLTYLNEVLDDVLDVELDDALGYEWQQLQWWTDDEVLSTKDMHYLYNYSYKYENNLTLIIK